MAGTYPFIDIAVLDGIRERFIRGDALLVVSPDLTTVIWANGPGAAMFGFDRIDDITGSAPDFPVQFKRQIMALDGSRQKTARTVSVRFASRLIALQVLDIALPDGTPARVLAAPGPPADIETAIHGLGDEDTHVALLDDAGAILARSAHFDGLGILATTLSDLIIEVRDEDSRTVKRRVRAGMRSVPAGIARLSDDPYRHLLFVIAEVQAEQPIAASAETSSAEAELPSPEIVGDLLAQEKEEEAETPLPAEPDSLRQALIREGLLRQEPQVPDEPKEAVQDEERQTVERLDLSSPVAEPVEVELVEEEPAKSSEEQLEDIDEEQNPIAVAAEADEDTAQPAAFVFNPDAVPARFVWKVDAETVFNEVSPEFAAAIGPQAADIIGRRFADVARVFGFDEDGAIATLLEGRDTWSGRTVLWPIEGTSLRAPIDLAALPVFSRERNFLGFRGFGVARIGEAQDDPDAIGLALVTGPAAVAETVEEAEPEEAVQTTEPITGPITGIVDLGEMLAQKQDVFPSETPKPDPFHGETPALQFTASAGRRVHDKIIRLEEHRAPRPESTGLTQTERNAFREIADRLRKGGILPSKNEVIATAEPEETKADSEPADDSGIVILSEEQAPDQIVVSHEVRPLLLTPQEEEQAPETVAPPLPSAAIVEEQEEAEGEEPVASEAEENDASIIARLPLPVLVHSGDIVHYANPALLDLTAYETVEALIEAGGLAALFAERETDEDGKPGAMMLRRADGTERAVDAHLQAISWKGGRALMLCLMPQPERPEEEPAGAAILPDEDSRALETRIGELTSILDTATDGVVIIGPDGLIRSMNHSAEALFGYEPQQVKGKSFSILFAIESQRAALDYLDGLADNGVASVLNDGREVIGREAQGRFIPMFMTIGKLAASNSYCAVLRDITQWKRAEEELTNARREAELASSQKTEFLARISHEIRTPLNAIIGFSELMADEKFGPVGNERYRDYLRDINRSGNHVLALVNDLLDISKIEAGGLDMEFEAVSLNDAIAEAVAIMQPQANRERVIIRSSFPANLPDIVADTRSIKQIALNLLSNAVRFTAPGGQVIVSTSYEANGGVVIRVRDTGIGMSASEIEQALKPFKQVNAQRHTPADGHTDWRQSGTGLGLPLTKAMVEANRAAFSIESTPGSGTMVEVSFPSTRVLAD